MVRTSLFLLLVSSHILVTYSLCTDSPSEWIPDPKDCKVFYLCSEGERLKYVCQAGTVANIQYRLCVKAGTSIDSCSHKQNITKGIVNQLMPTTQPTTVQTPTTPIIHCRKPGLYPVSSNCARHILCSPMLTASSLECPYPKLFNTETLKCEMPGVVKCGTRYEPLDPCEYSENHCSKSHCIPCNIRYPSCRGLPDGLNPWSGREGSPYFAICRSQRVVFQGKCSYEENSAEQVFDSKLKVCVKAQY